MIQDRMKIILVEDEYSARKGLRKLIESIEGNYEIIAEAADGKHALDLIKSLKPDIVFTDIKMPFMDGIALIKAINSIDKQVNFIITSAYEEFDFAKQAIYLGVFDYLVKPITYPEVEEILIRLRTRMSQVNEENINMGHLVKDFPDAHPMIKKALIIIEDGYAINMKQEELAEKLGMTKEYFSYLFRKNIGQTFTKYLRTYRINRAIMMLRAKKISKKEIPYCVGFSDPKYFQKVFKEVTGETVNEYIRNHI